VRETAKVRKPRGCPVWELPMVLNMEEKLIYIIMKIKVMKLFRKRDKNLIRRELI